ncbi:MAG: tRNA uridine-5-carboxymethylaminomethyl(34) synthesis GTPase MnmE, partial [Actinobacteria bacterium]|nr:tRNA uridine-5-carboxymethylaminomethyl(34) synthesis GTPase MnmE [Actinomycetota bacterium]
MKNSLDDTIVAQSTKPGESAIGIIRISGKNSIKIADKIFKAKNNKTVKSMPTYTIAYGIIEDENGEIIDQVILTLMRSPKSYTTEDVVEINCHGGLLATKKVMELAVENGARIAEPGEFTKRAYLNGRIDLSQAEAVIELITAKTEQSLKIAAKNIKGETGQKIKNLKKSLLDVIVELEASIDFIEEDLEITPYEKLKEKTMILSKEIKQLLEDEKKGELVKNGIKVSIAGKPNVGKSSLLNALAKKEKAIVTHIPGTTRDAIEEIIYVEGIPVILTDTAGIRETKNIIEQIGVKKSIEHIEESDIIIMMIDCSRKLEKSDENILNKLNGKKIVLCINKIDLENVIDVKKLYKI